MAVSKDTNTFFVSDGYCNSRIIKYTVTVAADGKHEVSKAKEWGKGAGPFSITKVGTIDRICDVFILDHSKAYCIEGGGRWK